MDLPVSPSGQTDKDMRLSWGESQSVLSSRMCPSGWTYRSALPGKQIASHGVSHRASSLAGCVLLDGPTGHADKAHRCSKHKPYNGWILQWSRPLLQGYRHTERLSWGESFRMDLLVTPTRHTDAANTSPTTGGSYSGPGLYCRATETQSASHGVSPSGWTYWSRRQGTQMQQTQALQRVDPTVVQASTAGLQRHRAPLMG
jgi:hypothetical protein